MKPRLLLATILIPLGLVMALVPQNTTKKYKLTAEELLEEANSGVQYFSPDRIADMIISNDPSLQLIDVRDQDAYEKYHLPGALNIPLSDLLAKQWEPYINQDVKINVFYSNGSLKADQAWMITRQLGYKNNYVLQGGLNYWVETIMSPEEPGMTSPNEEFARYDFREGAGQALGGGTIKKKEDTTLKPVLPPIQTKPKKKRVQGGC